LWFLLSSSLYYNFADESFMSKKLCSRLHSIEVEFYSKREGQHPQTGQRAANFRLLANQ